MSNGLDGHITDGRDNAGRFGTGNTYGKGRPKRIVEIEYVNALHEICTVEMWKQVLTKAVQQATEGEPKARTFLASYLLGKPEIRVEYVEIREPEMTREESQKVLLEFLAKYENSKDEKGRSELVPLLAEPVE